MYKRFFKRAIDIVASAGVLTVFFIPLSLISLWLHFANKGAGIFFYQKRPGKDERIFKIVKFKTMTDEKDADGNLLPDAVRVTKVGKLIRSTSIDELPQLWNVLKGDMSLIGPRPLLPEYLPYYTEEERLRHDVRPGITGWAQIHGRSNSSWEEKFNYDVWYTRNISFKLDCKIVAQTFINVLKREDIIVPKGIRLDKERKSIDHNVGI